LLEGLMQHDHALTIPGVVARMRTVNGASAVTTMADDGRSLRRATFDTVTHYVLIGECDPGALARHGEIVSYEDLLAGSADFDYPEFDDRSAAALCYTTGTTGSPKGVLYSHRSSYLHSLAICLPDALGVCSDDIVLPVVPMFHANAWVCRTRVVSSARIWCSPTVSWGPKSSLH